MLGDYHKLFHSSIFKFRKTIDFVLIFLTISSSCFFNISLANLSILSNKSPSVTGNYSILIMPPSLIQLWLSIYLVFLSLLILYIFDLAASFILFLKLIASNTRSSTLSAQYIASPILSSLIAAF